jgi:conjugal transfer pilus assembly protein TraV
MKRFAVGVSVVGALVMLTGCGVKYQCPTPTGVACMSAPQVYKLTNAPGQAGIEAAEGALTYKGHYRPGKRHVASAAETVAAGGPVTPLPKPGDVIPIREQARVMRVWIAPWIDVNGNLNMATRVYTEIQHKRWSVGEPAVQDSTNFFPLQVEEASSAVSATNTTGSPDASVTASGTDGAAH